MIYMYLIAVGMALAAYIHISTCPRVEQSRQTEWLRSVPIAHRGLHDDQRPENSLAAFAAAKEAGYAIEMDLQLTADCRVIVFHDYNLKRMTGLDKKVSDLTWEQIQELRLHESDQGVPLFSDLLSLVHGEVPLLIEIKNEGAVGALEQMIIDLLEGYTGRYAVQSFNPFVMKYFVTHAPQIVRGQLSSNFKNDSLAFWKKFLLRNLLLNFISRPSFIAYEFGALPGWFARRVRQKGLLLLAWTVASPEDYAQAKKRYDNVIFEGFTAPL